MNYCIKFIHKQTNEFFLIKKTSVKKKTKKEIINTFFGLELATAAAAVNAI